MIKVQVQYLMQSTIIDKMSHLNNFWQFKKLNRNSQSQMGKTHYVDIV